MPNPGVNRDGVRRGFIHALPGLHTDSHAVRLGLAAAFAGFTALMAQVSIPLPFTPVPLTLQTFAVVLAGAALGRAYGFLSLVLYLLAGAVGIRVFAQQESTGLEILSGYTAGYLIAFPFAAYLVGWYIERPRRMLSGRAAWLAVAGVLVAGLGAVATLFFVRSTGSSLGPGWTPVQDVAWVLTGLMVLVAAAVAFTLSRRRGRGSQALNLFLVLVGATMVLYVGGVLVLKPLAYPDSWAEAVARGATVFLPFDLLKCAAAALLAVPFMPSPHDTDAA